MHLGFSDDTDERGEGSEWRNGRERERERVAMVCQVKRSALHQGKPARLALREPTWARFFFFQRGVELLMADEINPETKVRSG